MKSVSLAIEILRSVINGYIRQYGNTICKNYVLWGEPGVPRARQMLLELHMEVEAKKKNVTIKDLAAVVNQIKFRTGTELRSMITDTLFLICEIEKEKIPDAAKKVAAQLNKAIIPNSRMYASYAQPIDIHVVYAAKRLLINEAIDACSRDRKQEPLAKPAL